MQSHSHLLNDKQMGYIIEIIEFQYYFASKDLNRQVCNLRMIECSIIHSDGCFRCQHDFFLFRASGQPKGVPEKKTKGIILFSMEDILRMINIELRISFDELYSCLHHLPGFEHFWGNG